MRIVLLHAFSEEGACWGPFVERLGVEALTPDARGHGETPLAAPGLDPEDLVADAVALIEPLGPVVLGGHSMGARTALEVAARRPDLVAALLLEDPALWPGTSEEEMRQLPDPGMFADVRQAMRLDAAARLARVRELQPHWDERERALWAAALGRLDPGVFGPGFFTYRRPWRETAAAVRAPTLLVRGEHGLTPAGTPWPTVTIAGAAHTPRRDRPAETSDAVRAFLADVSRSLAVR